MEGPRFGRWLLAVGTAGALAACGSSSTSTTTTAATTTKAAPSSAASTSAASTTAAGKKLSATLSGADESPGDPKATGTATVTLDTTKSQVCWELAVKDLTAPTAAHIHEGGKAVAGPIVVPFTPPANGTSTGCANADKALIDKIAATPSNYYVNVHNNDFKAGAIRGQLS